MDATQLAILVVVGAVLVIGVVSSISDRIGVAAPIALVLVGAGLGAIPGASGIRVDPELILTVVLPPILYAAARTVPFVDFRRNLRVILFLSVGLVLVSAFLVATLVHLVWIQVSFVLALALGAVVSPPDAVAATALAKRIGLPPRIVTILEGEGLINDATALVLLSAAVGIATAQPGSLNGGLLVLEFIWAVVGASVIGALLGVLSVRIRQRIENGVLDTAISLALPFLAYIAADLVGSSGVVAVVAAGIVVGNSSPYRVSAPARFTEDGNWRLTTIVLENGVFLYMGLQLWPLVGDVVRGPLTLIEVVLLAVGVTVLLVAARFAVLPGVLWTIRRRVRRQQRRYDQVGERIRTATDAGDDASDSRGSRASRLVRFRWWEEVTGNDLAAERDQALGWREAVILGFAGMRGVVTVAAAQTLPDDQYRSGLVLVAYLVAIITLLGQGLSLPALVRVLHPRADRDTGRRGEIADLRRVTLEAGEKEIDRLVDDPEHPANEQVRTQLRAVVEDRKRRVDAWGNQDLSDPTSDLARVQSIRIAGNRAERVSLRRERSRGKYSSEAVAFVGRTLDSDELQMRLYTSDPDA